MQNVSAVRATMLVPSILGMLNIMSASLSDATAVRTCGGPIGNTRIVGGSDTNFGEHGFMVLIRNLAAKYEVWCGGALLDKNHVVTAAHCIKGHPHYTFDLWIRTHNQKHPAVTSGEKFRIAKAEFMSNFTKRTYENDVAVLTLDRPVTFGAQVWPVCLPDAIRSGNRFSNNGDSVDAAGSIGTVLGWGYDKEGGINSETLKKADVQVLSQEQCKQWYTEAGISKAAAVIGEYHLCAGVKAGGKDSCQGDSGGPLVRKIDGAWTLIGIVSAGIGCGQPNQPGLYARVTKYKSWIRSKMDIPGL